MFEQASKYKSYLLSDEAPHLRHYGWRLASEGDGFRVLQRRYGPVLRSLVLATGEGAACAARMLAAQGPLWGFADVYFHDFDGVLSREGISLCLAGFHTVSKEEGLLPASTMLLDLTPEESALWSGVARRHKRSIAKADEAGVSTEHFEEPAPDVFDDFYKKLVAMGRRQDFAITRREVIEHMYARGDATLYAARVNGERIMYLHVYRTKDTGVLLHLAGEGSHVEGAGHKLHWDALRDMKTKGLHWCDMGGGAQEGVDDGIVLFKKGFGAERVQTGQTYRRDAPLLDLAMSVRASLQQWTRRGSA